MEREKFWMATHFPFHIWKHYENLAWSSVAQTKWKITPKDAEIKGIHNNSFLLNSIFSPLPYAWPVDRINNIREGNARATARHQKILLHLLLVNQNIWLLYFENNSDPSC
jgi:hypothetical protein